MLLACGTSWHAALVGKFLLEQVAQVPAEVDYGSEFRYRTPIVGLGHAGGRASARAARPRTRWPPSARPSGWARCRIAICNVQGSMLTREAAGTLLTHAGPEIGVASTKAFTSQIVALALLALHLGRLRGTLAAERCRDAARRSLARCPTSWSDALLASRPQIEELARTLAQASDFLFLGRGINYPIALEGALKLKEISYIHAEGYPAGEMKHGPIALIDERMPVVALCPPGAHLREDALERPGGEGARRARASRWRRTATPQLREILEPPT